jgi:hypothetical protein
LSVSNRTIIVDTPFGYEHISAIEQYGTDRLTMQAEVALLSRNIQIIGDNDTSISQYGPHLMFTSTSFGNLNVQVAFVELMQCGQPQIPGRHCLFFNMGKDLPNSYLRGNSIH